MQKEADHRKFDTTVMKVHECVVSTTGVSKNAIKRIKKESLNLQASAATSYNTSHRIKTTPDHVQRLTISVCVWCTEQYTNYICMKKGYQQLRLS
jgi:hypothetical protein